MVSQFEQTIRKARESGEAKLKVIAPKYNVPSGSSYGRPSSGGGSSSRSSRSSGPSQAQIAAAQAAEKVRQAELQRKQAEAKKLADEVKSVKLAKIQSQKDWWTGKSKR